MAPVSKVIAIDGPSGSGKTTVARRVAEKLGYLYIDTGAMFRTLGYYFHHQGIPFEESEKLKTALKNIHMVYYKSIPSRLEIEGVDVTEKIREHYVSDLASRISRLPSIRTYLLEYQRQLAQTEYCVMEGRDIGTVVFPDAFLKIFLSATDEERARRRFQELQKKGQQDFTYEQILEDLKKRDEADSTREMAPLKQADDAVKLDSTQLSIDDVVEKITSLAQNKRKDEA